MNKELYMNWLNKKLQQNRPDGPISESRSLRRRIRRLEDELEYHKGIAAMLADREAALNTNRDEPVSLEPKSGLANFNPTDARHSIKIPAVPPLWSYSQRNALGVVSEGTASTNPAMATKGNIEARKQEGLSTRKFKARDGTKTPRFMPTSSTPKSTALAKQSSAMFPVKFENPVKPEEKSLAVIKKPEEKSLAVRPDDKPLAVRTDKPLAVTQPPQATPVKPPIKLPPRKSTGPKRSGQTKTNVSGAQDPHNPRSDQKSSYTMSVQSVSVGQPGIIRGGVNVAESHNMTSLINKHINRFLRTPEGKQLRQEAKGVLTQKKD